MPLTVCRVDADDPLPRRRDGGARHRPHRLPHPHRAARRSPSCSTSARAHVGEFGSRANIAAAKAELPQALPAEGLAVLNARRPARRRDARRPTVPACSSSASSPDAGRARRGRRPRRARQGGIHPRATPRQRPVTLRQSGAHHVGNSLAVAAAALELGARRSTRSPPAVGRRAPRAAGGWSSPSGPTASSSSTTPTTPTPTRCAPRSTPWPPWPSTGRRLGRARRHARARRRQRGRARRPSGAYAARLGFDRLVAVGEGARPVAAAFPGAQSGARHRRRARPARRAARARATSCC